MRRRPVGSTRDSEPALTFLSGTTFKRDNAGHSDLFLRGL